MAQLETRHESTSSPTGSPSSRSSARTSSRGSSSRSRATSARRCSRGKITRAAYERGAKFVDVLYFDQWLKRERIAHAAEDTLDYVPPWMRERLFTSRTSTPRASRSPARTRRARSTGLDPARAGRDLLPYLPETGEVVNRMTTSWCIVPVPTPSWAELVYPDLDARATALRAALGGRRAHLPPRRGRPVCGVDGALDGAEGERAAAHRSALRRAAAPRARHRPHDRALPVGTLGCRRPRDGRRPAPLAEPPDRGGLQHAGSRSASTGYVSATMPLELSGSIIENIRVEFEGGRAVKIDADSGADALRAVAARDEGASRLGEIALVDGEGRIGPLGRVFYDTLIDENAASHIALGGGYEHPVDDPAGQGAREPERRARRLHDRQPRARRRRHHARRQTTVPASCARTAPGGAQIPEPPLRGVPQEAPRLPRPRAGAREARRRPRRDRRAAAARRGSRARRRARRAASSGSGPRRPGRARARPR